MAETYTEAGLDYLYNAGWRQASQNAAFWVFLFVSQTPTTVPASTASGASGGWTEAVAATGTYARQAVAASSINAAGSVGGSARGSTWPQVTFTGFTTAAGSPINGYGIATGSVGSAGSPLMFVNFDSGASRAMATTSDQLLVTPAVRGTP